MHGPPPRLLRIHPGLPQVFGIAFLLVLNLVTFGWKPTFIFALGLLLAFTCGLMFERYRR